MTWFELLGLIEHAESDPTNDVLFRDAVCAVMEACDLSFYELADRFTTSVPAVKRWVKGTTAPHPAMRPQIYAALEKLLFERKIF